MIDNIMYYDKVNDHIFNEILWKGIKGEDAIVPAPRRTAFVRIVDQANAFKMSPYKYF